jgi:hypothetical protein
MVPRVVSPNATFSGQAPALDLPAVVRQAPALQI